MLLFSGVSGVGFPALVVVDLCVWFGRIASLFLCESKTRREKNFCCRRLFLFFFVYLGYDSRCSRYNKASAKRDRASGLVRQENKKMEEFFEDEKR